MSGTAATDGAATDRAANDGAAWRIGARLAGEAGHVAVEYALTLPYLLLFCYGLMEISHFCYLRISMANIAHDAVRYAVVHSSASTTPKVAADISSYTNTEITNYGLSTGAATVTVTYNTNNAPGSTVNVSISYVFTPFMPGFNTIPGTATSFTDVAGPIVGSAQMIIGP
jgi:Flp pilus assembly protein TadG